MKHATEIQSFVHGLVVSPCRICKRFMCDCKTCKGTRIDDTICAHCDAMRKLWFEKEAA